MYSPETGELHQQVLSGPQYHGPEYGTDLRIKTPPERRTEDDTRLTARRDSTPDAPGGTHAPARPHAHARILPARSPLALCGHILDDLFHGAKVAMREVAAIRCAQQHIAQHLRC